MLNLAHDLSKGATILFFQQGKLIIVGRERLSKVNLILAICTKWSVDLLETFSCSSGKEFFFDGTFNMLSLIIRDTMAGLNNSNVEILDKRALFCSEGEVLFEGSKKTIVDIRIG